MKTWMWIGTLMLLGCGAQAPSEEIVIVLEEPDVPVEDMTPDVAPPAPAMDILDRLKGLEGLGGIKELEGADEYRVFSLEISQPVDHQQVDSPRFRQKLLLYHRSEDAPMVMVNSGYGLATPEMYTELEFELSDLLGANTLMLGHRFYSGAIPAAEHQDWSTVTVAQAAADNHQIVETLRAIYDVPWVGTGWSKGGTSTMLHAQFYPDDLDLTVPMVAPISRRPKDPIYQEYLAQLGTPECREELETSIRGALPRLDEMLMILNTPPAQIEQMRVLVTYYIIVNLWSFWQDIGLPGCGRIPDPATASAEELVQFFLYQQLPPTPGRPLGDQESFSLTYTYQAMTQLGYQQAIPREFLDALQDDGLISNFEVNYIDSTLREQYQYESNPWDLIPSFNPAPMRELDTWLRQEATDMLAIYGAYDPWTGGRVTLDAGNGSKVFIAPESSHGTMLQDLSDEDYREVEARILSLLPGAMTGLRAQRPRPPKIARQPLLRLLRARAL